MGKGYVFSCPCGHSETVMLGGGKRHIEELEKLKTKIENGEYGEEILSALKSSPKNILDGKLSFYECLECGKWKVEPSLDVYAADEKETAGFVVREMTECIYRHPHVCECGNEMRDVTDSIMVREVKCPKCGEVMSIMDMIMWD